jgi:hypothetical protein
MDIGEPKREILVEPIRELPEPESVPEPEEPAEEPAKIPA